MAASSSGSRTILLALFALGIGLYVYYGEMLGKERKAVSKRLASKVYTFTIDEIRNVHLVARGDTIKSTRAPDGSWSIQRPAQDIGDNEAWQTLGRSFAATTRNRDGWTVDRDELSDFGLEHPAVEVAFALADSSFTDTLTLGNPTRSGKRVYACWKDSTDIFTLEGALLANSDKSIMGLRSIDLLEEGKGASDVISISVARAKDEISFSREGTRWLMAAPSPAMVAEKDTVIELVRAVDRTKILGFLDQFSELSDYGLDEPELTLTTKTSDGSELTLIVGDRAPWQTEARYARIAGRPPVLVISSDLFEKGSVPADNFRSRKVLDFVRAEVNRVEWHYSRNNLLVAVADSASMWKVENHGNVDAHRPAVNMTVARVDQLTSRIAVVNPRSLRRFGLSRPRYRIKLMKGATVLDELHVGKNMDGRTWVKSAALPVVYNVPNGQLEDVEVSLSDLLPPKEKDTEPTS